MNPRNNIIFSRDIVVGFNTSILTPLEFAKSIKNTVSLSTHNYDPSKENDIKRQQKNTKWTKCDNLSTATTTAAYELRLKRFLMMTMLPSCSISEMPNTATADTTGSKNQMGKKKERKNNPSYSLERMCLMRKMSIFFPRSRLFIFNRQYRTGNRMNIDKSSGAIGYSRMYMYMYIPSYTWITVEWNGMDVNVFIYLFFRVDR